MYVCLKRKLGLPFGVNCHMCRQVNWYFANDRPLFIVYSCK